MSDFEKPRLRAALTTDLRLKAQLMARVQTVQLLHLGETQIAELIREIESDPFFQRLLRPGNRDW